MKVYNLFLCFFLVSSIMGFGCVSAKVDVEVPEPPDVADLVARYAAPTGVFSEEQLPFLMDRAGEAVDLFESFGGLKPVLESISGVEESEQGLMALAAMAGGMEDRGLGDTFGEGPGEVHRTFYAVDVGGQEVSGDGYMEVTRICGGWSSTGEIDKKVNGYVSITMVFDDSGINPVIWGSANNCRYLLGGKELLINGSIRVYAGQSVTSLWSEENKEELVETIEIIIDFVGEMEIDEKLISNKTDFKLILSKERVEFSCDTPEGNIVYYIQQEEQGFVASNGEWICNISALTCEKR